jgi:membrane fusion protein, multidrug efflux system
VDTLRVAAETWTQDVRTTGSLLADESVELRVESPGTVVYIGFDEGAFIRAGTVLVKVDDREPRAALLRAERRHELALVRLRRTTELFEGGGVSVQQFDEARIEASVLEAEVQVIREQIRSRETRAPCDGIVGLRRISLGAFVTPATPFATFTATERMKLDFSLPERFSAQVAAGQRVTFQVAGDDAPREAVITAIEPGVDVSTRTLTVRAETANPAGALRPGAFARVTWLPSEPEQAVFLPAQAVVPSASGSGVFIVRDGKAQLKSVVVAGRVGDRIRIAEGLSPGDEVVVSGVQFLRNGSSVAPRGASGRSGA